MSENSEKSSLEDFPFSFRTYKNGSVSVFYKEREVTILKGKNAENFLSKVESRDDLQAQMVMAKITGNFKRGNERQAKIKSEKVKK